MIYLSLLQTSIVVPAVPATSIPDSHATPGAVPEKFTYRETEIYGVDNRYRRPQKYSTVQTYLL